MPQNRAELDALKEKTGELNLQLEAVTKRRELLAEQIRQSDLTTRPALQGRLKALDDRSARLEAEILQSHDAIANALARGVTATQAPDPWQLLTQQATQPPKADFGTARDIVLVEAAAFVLLGFVLWRYYLKRAAAKFARPAVDPSKRLDQLQNAVDSIAVEVERISEGQRYVTRIMDERLRPSIGVGEAEPIPVHRKAAAPVRASDDA